MALGTKPVSKMPVIWGATRVRCNEMVGPRAEMTVSWHAALLSSRGMRERFSRVAYAISFPDRGMHDSLANRLSMPERIASAAPPASSLIQWPRSRAAYRAGA
jgi:hypothetical protein